MAQPVIPKDSTLFSLLKSSFDKHEEDNNIDFYYEHNVPKMLSREGPKAAVGDVNGMVWMIFISEELLFIRGQLYLQTRTEGLKKRMSRDLNSSVILKMKPSFFSTQITTATWISI
ncbi:MAG: hypothetical protein WDM78_20920 [Puia sp.]